MRPAKNQTIPAAVTHALYWAMVAAFFAFVTAYLVDNGYSDVQTGWISAAMYLTSTVFGPLTGYIADIHIPARKFLTICFAASAPLMLLLPLVVKSIWAVLLIIPFVTAAQYLLCGVLDSMLVRIHQRSHNLDFPISRSTGSIFYSVSCVIVGRLIAVFGYQAMFVANVVLIGATILAMLFLEYVPCAAQKPDVAVEQTQQEEKIGFFKAFGMLMQCREFVVYIIAMALFLYGVRLTLVFQANLVYPVGGTAEHVGWAGAVAAVFEVPFIMMMRKPERFAKRGLAAFLLGVGALKPLLFLLWPTPLIFVLSQIFQAIPYGFQLVFSMEYIKKHTPAQLYSTATMIYTTVNMGLGCTLAAITGGYMLECGRELLLIISTVCMLAGAVVLAMSKVICKSKTEVKA